MSSHSHNRFKVESFITFLEKIFKGRSKKIHNHNVVSLIFPKVKQPRYSKFKAIGVIIEISQKFSLILQLLVFGFEWFHFDCNNLVVLFVDSVVDLSKGPGCYLAGEFIVFSNYHLHCYIFILKL